jgi:pyridoxamine 5'-phosphate oxidase
MSEDHVAGIRREYTHAELVEKDLAPEPMAQFRVWMGEALAAGVIEPTAMTVATVGRAAGAGEGWPSARVVLLKGYDERGFVFYTNYESRKGRELEENPRAALVFHWPQQDRQVRIEGTVEKTSRAETEAYFASRPVKSQLGAWASHQSAPIGDREELERALAAVTERFAGGEVPAPGEWGGYRVRPSRVEFWQGRRSRLHDRLVYVRREPDPVGGSASASAGVPGLSTSAPGSSVLGSAASASSSSTSVAPAGLAGAASEWTIERLQP